MSTSNKQEHSDSYEFGFIIGVKDARTEGPVTRDELDALASIAYSFASKSLRMDREDFIAGYQAGYVDYLNGIV